MSTSTFKLNAGRVILEPLTGLALVSWIFVTETILTPEVLGGVLKEGGAVLIAVMGFYFYRRDFKRSLAEVTADRGLLIEVINKNTEALVGVKDVVGNCNVSSRFQNSRH